jgi:CRISPR-associated protein Csm1
MSVQVFLQARVTGIERFLAGSADELETRAHWASLFIEVLPRALLTELGLAPILLGFSGGEQFVIVLPSEARERAQQFLARIAGELTRATNGVVRLVWSSTENLGDWSDVRRRLSDELAAKIAAPAAENARELFEPGDAAPPGATRLLAIADGVSLRDAVSAGWSPEEPLTVRVPTGTHTWTFATPPDGILFPVHAALDDATGAPARLEELAARSRGRATWGILRGDIDGSEARLQRAQTIDEHLQLLIMYRQFFAGELPMLCSMGDYFRKITLLRTGVDDFAVYGAWDALIPFAREMQRLFERFVDANLRELAGNEGKTISMGLALASEPGSTPGSVYRAAGENLEIAKSSAKDSIHLLGRTLEWKQLADAADTRSTLARMVSEFGCSPQLLYEIASFYRGGVSRGRARNVRVERPWRFHRRLNRVISSCVTEDRSREFERVRNELISDLTGHRAAQLRLRPAGRVALEWAKLETE